MDGARSSGSQGTRTSPEGSTSSGPSTVRASKRTDTKPQEELTGPTGVVTSTLPRAGAPSAASAPTNTEAVAPVSRSARTTIGTPPSGWQTSTRYQIIGTSALRRAALRSTTSASKCTFDKTNCAGFVAETPPTSVKSYVVPKLIPWTGPRPQQSAGPRGTSTAPLRGTR